MKTPVLLVVLTIAFLVLSVFSYRPFLGINPFFSFIHFLGFYLLGLSLFRFRHVIDGFTKTTSLALSAAGVLAFLLALKLYMNSPAMPDTFFNQIGKLNFLQLGKLGLLIAIFIFLEKFGNVYNFYMAYLAKISFGLFLVHGFYIAIFVRLIAFRLNVNNNIAKLIVEFAVVVSFSLFTVIFLKKILRGRSKYVIGC